MVGVQDVVCGDTGGHVRILGSSKVYTYVVHVVINNNNYVLAPIRYNILHGY
jgi:hypothetical protein